MFATCRVLAHTWLGPAQWGKDETEEFCAPASWLMHCHISEGRRRLNFSTWEEYAADPGTKAQKLKAIAQFVSSGTMAPQYYRLLHTTWQVKVARQEERR